MRIAIIGLGSMGKSVKEIAESKGHKVDITIDPNNKEATHKTTNGAPLEDVDLVVDFSESSSIIENAKRVALAKKNLVIGTTGWYEKLPEIEKIAKENDIGIM